MGASSQMPVVGISVEVVAIDNLTMADVKVELTHAGYFTLDAQWLQASFRIVRVNFLWDMCGLPFDARREGILYRIWALVNATPFVPGPTEKLDLPASTAAMPALVSARVRRYGRLALLAWRRGWNFLLFPPWE